MDWQQPVATWSQPQQQQAAWQQQQQQHEMEEEYIPPQHLRQQQRPVQMATTTSAFSSERRSFGRERQSAPSNEGMFSEAMIARAKFCFADAMLTRAVEYRNGTVNAREDQGMAMRTLSIFTAEIVAVLTLPVAAVEAVVRLAASTLMYAVAVIGLIDDPTQGDCADSIYYKFLNGHVFALLAGIKALHTTLANVNPWNKEIRLDTVHNHFPIASSMLGLHEAAREMEVAAGNQENFEDY